MLNVCFMNYDLNSMSNVQCSMFMNIKARQKYKKKAKFRARKQLNIVNLQRNRKQKQKNNKAIIFNP